jgi:hypothetical protein
MSPHITRTTRTKMVMYMTIVMVTLMTVVGRRRTQYVA